MDIYHYTTLENLVLILKNKTIRFNRLDRMDDPCEHRFYSYGLNWSPYTYVSCWTTADIENIPLWHMYSKGGVGVRISLDRDCIDWDKMLKSGFKSMEHGSHPPVNANQGCMKTLGIRPYTIFGDINTSKCFHNMNYIKEMSDYKIITIGDNKTLVNKCLTEAEFEKYIGLYKDDRWSFQNEVRFRIFVVPGIVENLSFNELSKIIKQEISNPFDHFDLPLKASALKNLKITLGHNSSESAAIILKLIRDKFAPNAKIMPSTLNSNIKLYQ